jgi:aryl-alcohol dehydrogenase-like predicted oxidoreductase
MQKDVAERREQLTQFDRLCRELGESPSVIALSWLLHQFGVAATIIGPASAEQLESVLQVPDIRLDSPTLEQLDEIFPPCGEAPEAYAW